MVSSIIAAIAFGLVALWLLYKSWSFSTAIGAYRRERRSGHNNKEDKKMRKNRKKYEKKDKQEPPEGIFSKMTFAYIHRLFHNYVLAYMFGITCAGFALYYVVQYTGILFLTRASDGLDVNPFRWWFLQPVGAIVTGAMAGMLISLYMLDLGIVAALNIGGRVLLGVAILLPVNTTSFWVVYGVSAASALIAALFLWGRESARTSRSMAVGYYLIINLGYYLLFLASYEVEAWLSVEWTLALFPVLDGLAIIIPAILVMTDWFYNNYGVPVLPLFIYEAYAVGHWWRGQTSSELHYLWPEKMLMDIPNKHDHKHHRKTLVARTTDTKIAYTSNCKLCGHTEECKTKTAEEESGKKEGESSSGSESSSE